MTIVLVLVAWTMLSVLCAPLIGQVLHTLSAEQSRDLVSPVSARPDRIRRRQDGMRRAFQQYRRINRRHFAG